MLEPMQKRIFHTRVGDIWLWGSPESEDSDRPVVLFLNGAFSIERPRSFELPGLLPGAVVLNGHLPGNHCPRVTAHTLNDYAQGYSEALDQIGRPCVVVGASIGALVALKIWSTQVHGRVLLEPPLQTVKLWCLLENFRGMLKKSPDDVPLHDFLWNIFGISESTLENRDTRQMVAELTTPGWAVFGEAPLMPPRAITELPSLVDEPERALLRAHPLLKSEVIPTIGHNVPGRAISYVRRYTQDLLDRVVPNGPLRS